ncbi:MAG: transposase, partial [Epulopiscium sp.]|nr:transposase [Candidatus Epulonipiscium sp.]
MVLPPPFWINGLLKLQTLGPSREKNRLPEDVDLLRFRKENQQLKMENDILEQAALILGRKQM